MDIDEKYQELDNLKIENELQDQKTALAEKKRLEKEARKAYGPDWKKVLGIVGKVRVNEEALQSLYSMNMGELRDLNRLGGRR